MSFWAFLLNLDNDMCTPRRLLKFLCRDLPIHDRAAPSAPNCLTTSLGGLYGFGFDIWLTSQISGTRNYQMNYPATSDGCSSGVGRKSAAPSAFLAPTAARPRLSAPIR